MPPENIGPAQLVKQIKNQIRIRYIRQSCGLIIWLKGFKDIFWVIEKIKNIGAAFGFSRIGSVQAREGLHTFHTPDFFIHVHGHNFGWSNPV